jgi:hypothetical protein
MADSGAPRERKAGEPAAAPLAALAESRTSELPGSNSRNPVKRPSSATGIAAGRSTPIASAAKPHSHSGYYGTVRPPGAGGSAPRVPPGKIGGGVNSGVYSKVGNASGLNPRAAPAARSSAGTRAVPARSGVRSSMVLNCTSCGKAMSAEALSGSGKIICAECIDASKRRLASQQRTLKVVAAAAVVALVAVAVVLPQQAMFMLLLAGLGMLALGVVGAGWPRVARLGLFSAGLVAMAVGGTGLGALQEKDAQNKAQSLLQTDRALIESKLGKNEYLDAQHDLQALQVKVREHPADFNAQEASDAISALQEAIDKWVEARYPGLSPEGRALLDSLMRNYPDTPGAGRRIQSFKMDEQQLQLAMVSDVAANAPPAEKNGPPMNDPRAMEVRSIMLFLFDSIPTLKSVTLELGAAANEGEFKAANTIVMTRENLGTLRLGNLPPGVFSNK